jgi:pimeloyl-ACP methyl ester carboxylesterase
MLNHKITEEKKRTLLIIHGLFGSLDNWQTLAKKWSEHFRVLSIDVRNHGRSFHTESMSFEDMCGDIIKLLNHYGLQKISILGHSMGGKIAMDFAAAYPEFVEKLIIADVAPYKYDAHHKEVFEVLDAMDFSKFSNRAEIEAFIVSKLPQDKATAQFILKNIKRNEDTLVFEFKFNLKTLKSCYNYLIERIAPAGFDGKVLFLSGEHSNYITASTSTFLFDLYPQAEIEIIPDAGHWIHADNPEAVFEKVLNFVN